jgi:hypothetical protein
MHHSAFVAQWIEQEPSNLLVTPLKYPNDKHITANGWGRAMFVQLTVEKIWNVAV